MELYRHTQPLIAKDLQDEMCSLAYKISEKIPRLCLFSGSEQNKKSFELFSTYPANIQHIILSDFRKYSDIVNSILENNLEISNKSSLWLALKMFGIPSLNDDLFSSLEESDVIEVYRYDGIQVFRNLNFHDICSYELPELFIHKWDQLYYRAPQYTLLIANGAQQVFSGQHKGRLDLLEHGSHYIYELFSPRKLKLNIGLKYFYPLKNKSGQIEYGVSVSHVEVEEENYTHMEVESVTAEKINNVEH